MMRRSSRVPQITDAAPSRRAELHHREVRYVLMMSIRIVCLVLLTVLVSAHAPLLWLWIPILVLGIVVVPWLAVILANDRTRGDRYRLRSQPPAPPDQRALTEADEPPAPRVIDADME